MKITINQGQNFNEIKLKEVDSCKIKKASFEDEFLQVLVVGYPYFINSSTWASAEAVANSYKKQGLRFVDELDGIFYFVIIDKAKSIVHLIPDALGFYSLYVFIKGHQIFFSDYISNFPVEQCTKDDSALLQLLHFNFILGEDTLYKEIKKLRGGHIYSIGEGLSLRKTKYWQYSNKQKYTEADYKQGLKEAVKTAFSLSSKVALPLTAGLDSRLVLAQSLPYKGKLFCFTHGQAGNIDLKVAKKLCSMLKIPHEFYDVGYTNKEFVEQIPQTSAELTVEFECMANAIRFVHLKESFLTATAKSDTILTGVGGEMVHAYFAQLPSLSPTTFSTPNKAFINDVRSKLSVQAGYDIYTIEKEEVVEILNKAVEKEMEYIQSEDIHFLYDYFYLCKLSGFTASLQRYLGTAGQIFNVYLGKKLLDITAGIDYNLKKNRKLQKEILLEADKVLASLPVNEYENPDVANRRMQLVCYTNRGKRIFKKVVNRLARKEIFTLYSVNVGKLLLPDNFYFLQDNLLVVDHKLIKAEKLQFKHAGQINENNLYQLSALASVNLWLKKIEREMPSKIE